MITKPDQTEADRAASLMTALGNQYGRLQAARGGTIAESSSRSSLYLTVLTGAVVALSFVAQASKFGEAFFVFALALLPVLFFLGTVTYYRLVQTGVEDVIYARQMSKIQKFYSEIDPTHAELFNEIGVDQVGLNRFGLFRLRWQQFINAAAMVAMVSAIVGGVFIALMVDYVVSVQPIVAIAIGAVASLLIGFVFFRHQWRIIMHVAKMLPM